MSGRLLVGSALALAACFDPAVPEGLPCGPAPERACPADQVCAADGLCRGPGEGADAPRADARIDSRPGTPDATIDAAGGWTVTRIGEISDDVASDQDPSMTADLLEIVWSTDRGTPGTNDLWHATRADASLPFAHAEPLTALNSASGEQSPEIGRTGKAIYFVSGRGGGGDVWAATRSDTGGWSDPTQVGGLSTATNEYNLTVRENLFAVVDREIAADGQRDLFFHARDGLGDPWPAGVPIAELNTPANEGGPFLTTDRRTLYFHRIVDATMSFQIHVATRPTANAAFGPPVPIFDVGDSDPWASDDGDTMVFTRAGDIYLATRAP